MKKFIKPLMLLAMAGTLLGCNEVKAIIKDMNLQEVPYNVMAGRVRSIIDHNSSTWNSMGNLATKTVFTYEKNIVTAANHSTKDRSTYGEETFTLKVDLEKKMIAFSATYNIVDGFGESVYKGYETNTIEVNEDGDIISIIDSDNVKKCMKLTSESAVKAHKVSYGLNTMDEAYRDIYEMSIYSLRDTWDFTGTYNSLIENMQVMDENSYNLYTLDGAEDPVKFYLDETKTVIDWNYEALVDDDTHYMVFGNKKVDCKMRFDGFNLSSAESHIKLEGDYYVSSTELERNYTYTEDTKVTMEYGVAEIEYVDVSKIPLVLLFS